MSEEKQVSKLTYLFCPLNKLYCALKWIFSLPIKLCSLILYIPNKYIFHPIYLVLSGVLIKLQKTRIVLRGVWGKRFGILPIVLLVWAVMVFVFLCGASGLLKELPFFSNSKQASHYLLDSCRDNDIR